MQAWSILVEGTAGHPVPIYLQPIVFRGLAGRDEAFYVFVDTHFVPPHKISEAGKKKGPESGTHVHLDPSPFQL